MLRVSFTFAFTKKKLCEWKPIYTGLAGRQKTEWGNDLHGDLRIMKINIWKNASKLELNGRKWLRRSRL
jgi:hypothetical protein